MAMYMSAESSRVLSMCYWMSVLFVVVTPFYLFIYSGVENTLPYELQKASRPQLRQR